MLFIDEAHNLIDIKEGLWQRSNRGSDGKNECEHTLKETPIFIFAGYPCEMVYFLRVDPGLSRRIPNVLQLNYYTPMVRAEITYKTLLTYEMCYPHRILNR